MARKSSSAGESSASPRSSEVKMIKRHKEFQEADVEATQASAEPDYSGKNPFREKTAAWVGWENLKRMSQGKGATNSMNE